MTSTDRQPQRTVSRSDGTVVQPGAAIGTNRYGVVRLVRACGLMGCDCAGAPTFGQPVAAVIVTGTFIRDYQLVDDAVVTRCAHLYGLTVTSSPADVVPGLASVNLLTASPAERRAAAEIARSRRLANG